MVNEKGNNYNGIIDAFKSVQKTNVDCLESVRKACSLWSSIGKEFAEVSLPPIDQLQALSRSAGLMSDICSKAFENVDYTLLLNQCADAIHQFSFSQSLELVNIANSVLRNLPSFKVPTYNEEKLLGSCLTALEKIKPYVSEEAQKEIQGNVIGPAKKSSSISIDTVLSIASIVLTILIFLFEQLSGYAAQQASEKQIAALSESNQQLTDELGKLGGIIQQLTNEVSELSDQLDRSIEPDLHMPDSDRENDQQKTLN